MYEAYPNPTSVMAVADENTRATFIKRTYLHLAGAILAFAALSALWLQLPLAQQLGVAMVAKPIYWLIVLGAFLLVSHVAQRWALSSTSLGQQYLGLGLFVVAESIIFIPMMMMAQFYAGESGQSIIGQAGLITLFLFLGLTAVAFTTGKDFSFLGGILKIGFFAALGLIVVAVIFPGGLDLGFWFSAAMIVLAGGAILYDTSKIMYHYRTDQYVAASLGLFASIALLLWYVMRILMSRR